MGCDDAGNVVTLQLNNESISGGVNDSSSLFKLEHLHKLNLANNDFNRTPIPKGIHNLTNLTHLNLSYADFGGQVAAEILSLKRLVSLDISNDYRGNARHHTFLLNMNPLKLDHPTLEMLVGNLTGLTELYLDGVNVTSSREREKWSRIISSYLPNITALSLCQCSLFGPLFKSFWQLRSLSVLRLDLNDLSREVPGMFASFSSLTTLSLVGCGLEGLFPEVIFGIPSLENLDLSHNKLLSGSIPPFTQKGSVKSMRLSFTNFSGLIPSSISNLRSLSEIDLSNCLFTGSLPSTFASLTELTYVDLSYNFFTGSLSSTLFRGFSNLVYLNLGFNSFSGGIPPSVFRLPSLLEVRLSNNRFTGVLEEFPVVNLSNVVTIDLSSNQLEGHVPDSFFQLDSLEYLDLSKNLFSDVRSLSSSSYGISKVKEMHLASCELHDFPEFIKYSDVLEYLDLSNNRIVGEIPSWIWRPELRFLNLSVNHLKDLQKPYHMSAALQFLDLHSNKLRGEFHFPIPHASELSSLSLSNNSLIGTIPTSLCNATNLQVLDLSVNQLSGSVPSCLLGNIRLLDLGRNNLTGRIPDNFSRGCNLQYFDVSNNTLHGEIPRSLESCESLQFINIGDNIMNGGFPCMQSLSLRVLVLHSNRFHGEVTCHASWPVLQIVDISWNSFDGSLESINFSSWRAMVVGSEPQPKYDNSGYYSFGSFSVTLTMKGLNVEFVKIWKDFTTIDFSGNNFQGEVPKAIGDLISLRHLNFSHNAFSGSIPESFGQLRKLEALDLSGNQLTGAIPVELAELTFLSVLNLSYNKLVGEIPNGRQLQTFSADSFAANLGLCGFILNISCSRTDGDGSLVPEHEKREIEWEYVSAALGYVVGLGGFVWLLFCSRRFRKKYFHKIDQVVDEMLFRWKQ